MAGNRKSSTLDPVTLDVARRVLAMSPKKNKDLKIGKSPAKKKKRDPKGRASSSKPRGA